MSALSKRKERRIPNRYRGDFAAALQYVAVLRKAELLAAPAETLHGLSGRAKGPCTPHRVSRDAARNSEETRWCVSKNS